MASAETENIDKLLQRIRDLQKLLPSPGNSPRNMNWPRPTYSIPPEKDQASCSGLPRSQILPPKNQESINVAPIGQNSQQIRTKVCDEKRKNDAASNRGQFEAQQNSVGLKHRGRTDRANCPGTTVGSHHLGEVEESLELLRQVTFVRIAADKIVWDRLPQILLKDFVKHKSPRERGQIVLEYQFPVADNSYQTLKKRIRVVAKHSLPGVTHLEHRRVALIRITPGIVRDWSVSSLWFRILYQQEIRGKKTCVQLGKSSVQLGDLIELPFSIERSLHLEFSGSGSGAKGRLNVCIQLGSRFPQVTDRLEQLRRGSTVEPDYGRKIELGNLDAEILKKVLGANEKQNGKGSSQSSGKRGNLTSGSGLQKRPVYRSTENVAMRGNARASMFEPVYLPAVEHHMASTFNVQNMQRHHLMTDNDQQEENAHSMEDERVPSHISSGRFQPHTRAESSPKHTVTRHKFTNDVAVDQSSSVSISDRQPLAQSSRRYSTGLVMSSGSPMISPGSDLVDQGVQSRDWRSAGVQTEENSPSVFNDTFSVGVQNEGETQDNHGNEITPESSVKRVRKDSTRRLSRTSNQQIGTETVADRLLRQAEEIYPTEELDGVTEKLDGVNNNGVKLSHEQRKVDSSCSVMAESDGWIELTVHWAKNLPYVKNPEGRGPIPPKVFVTYRAEDDLKSSDVAPQSTNPEWNWTSKFRASATRKNLVLKFWHGCPIRGDRVLGFICLDLSRLPQKESHGTYDLVDLSQTSTGRVKISMKRINSDDDDSGPTREIFLGESFAASKLQMEEDQNENVPKRTCENLDKSMNTSGIFAPTELHRRSNMDEYLDMASKSFLADKLKTNMTELDSMMNRLGCSNVSDAHFYTYRCNTAQNGPWGSTNFDSNTPRSQHNDDFALGNAHWRVESVSSDEERAKE